jgi:hypothetical protein
MRRSRFAFAAALLLFAAATAHAHPSVENGLQVVVSRERVALSARISLAEVNIAHEIPSAGGPVIDPAKLDAVLKTHADYLLTHLDVRADDRPLVGKVTRVALPPDAAQGIKWEAMESTQATYDVEYALGVPLPRARDSTPGTGCTTS